MTQIYTANGLVDTANVPSDWKQATDENGMPYFVGPNGVSSKDNPDAFAQAMQTQDATKMNNVSWWQDQFNKSALPASGVTWQQYADRLGIKPDAQGNVDPTKFNNVDWGMGGGGGFGEFLKAAIPFFAAGYGLSGLAGGLADASGGLGAPEMFGTSSTMTAPAFSAGTGGLTLGNAPGILQQGAGFLNTAADAAGSSSALPASVTSAADPIEAMLNATQAAGVDTATAAANAYGFATPEAMLSSINPNWVTAGAAAGGSALGSTLGGQIDQGASELGSTGIPSSASSGATGASSGAGSALSRLLSGSATTADYASLLGTLGSTGLGLLGANAQSNSLNDLAKEFAGYGAPYRAQLSQLMANPSSFLTSPEVTTPVQMGTDALARSLSVNGNPAGSGGALTQIQKYATDSLYNQLQNKQNQLAGFGGLTAYNAAAPSAAAGAAQAGGNVYNVLGSGLSNLTNPPQTLQQQLQSLKGLYSLA